MPAFRVAAPCSANWDNMLGTDKVRRCPECQLDVFNFSAMTHREINEIVEAHTGRLCARFYGRADGTMLTEDCHAGDPATARFAGRFATAALATLVTIVPAGTRAVPQQSGASSIQMQSALQGLTLQIRDALGASISSAAVSLLNTKTGERWDLTTDSNGGFVFPDLPVGSYNLTVAANGFSSFVEKNLTVPGRAAITLQIRTLMGEVVSVTRTRKENGTELTSSEIPTTLVEPRSASLDVPPKPSEHRNALQRFFSKLHRVF